MSKRMVVVFDFDGVINSYRSNFVGYDNIPDPPVEGIREEIARIRQAGYRVVIVSSRCREVEGSVAIRKWLEHWDIEYDEVTAIKPPARAYIDDRAIRFTGDPTGLLEQIDALESWTKQETP